MPTSMPRSIVRRDGHAPLQEPEKIKEPVSNVPRRASRLRLVETQPDTEKQESRRTDVNQRPSNRRSPARQQRGVNWLLLVGVGMALALVLYLFGALLWMWGVGIHDDLTYGTTRTYHLEAVVGESDSPAHPTHFVAMNLHGQIDIIELPGGDATRAKIYPGPHLPWNNADKAVVTLEVKDVNGESHPDLVIHVRGEPDLFFQEPTATLVMLKNTSGFQSMTQAPSS